MTILAFETDSTKYSESGAQPLSVTDELAIVARIKMISAKELATALGFDGTTAAFRSFCHSAGIKPLPGRRNCYDPVAVRYRLDCLQGIGAGRSDGHGALDKSRMRRNA